MACCVKGSTRHFASGCVDILLTSRVICIPSIQDYQCIPDKVDWIKVHLGIDWVQRVMVVPDKALLQADIMVDMGVQDSWKERVHLLLKVVTFKIPKEEEVDKGPTKKQQGKKKSKHKQEEESDARTENVVKQITTEKVITRTPNWKMHVVYDMPWNKQCAGKRIVDWKSWKQAFELDGVPTTETDELKDIAFFHHGSEDSKDVDKLFLFKQLPSHKDCLKFTAGTSEDRNIFILSEGYVSDCFKGFPDEINNALLQTVPLHKQDHTLPIVGKVPRVVALKVTGAIKAILIKTRREPNYRNDLLKVISSKIDFCNIPTFGIEDFKYIAFQMGQTLSLMDGKELYTKRAISALYPDLEPFMKREENKINKAVLNYYRDQILDRMKGDLLLFSAKNEPSNLFAAQSRGMVIDAKRERLVCFPLTHATKLHADWTQDSEQEYIDPDLPCISAFMIQDSLHITGENQFENSHVSEVKAFLKKSGIAVSLDQPCTLVLQMDSSAKALRLVAARHHHTLRLLSVDELKDIAKKSKLSLSLKE